MSLLHSLPNTDYLPHGHCYFWQPELIWLHALSDGLIGLAYYSIPITLIYFLWKRQDISYKWFIWLMLVFVSCGTTHFLEVWTLWFPYYWFVGTIKAITALISMITAVALMSWVPRALALSNPAILQEEIQERQRVEQALRESEERFVAVLDQLPVFVYLQHADYSIKFANRYFRERFGEPGTRCCYEVIAGQSSPCEVCHTYRVFQDPTTPQIWETVAHDGRRYEVHDHSFIDHDGSQLVLGMGIDITERKQAEAALSQSEIRYRALFEDSPISLWEEDFSQVKQRLDALKQANITDFKSYFAQHPAVVTELVEQVLITDVNKSTLDLYGAQHKKQLLGRLSPLLNNHEAFIEELVAMAQGETQLTFEVPIHTWSGEIRQVVLKLSVLAGMADSYSKVLVSMLDITERKRAEERLKEQQELLRLVIDNIPQYIFWKDVNSIFLGCNQSFAESVKRPLAEIVGKTDVDFFSSTRAQDGLMVGQRVMQTDTAEYHIIQEVHDSDGQCRWIDSSRIPLHDTTGQVIGVLITNEDITERKQAELLLTKYRQQLESQVTIRTQELAEKNRLLELEIQERQLALQVAEQAKTEAEIANRAKSTFLAYMSHELRTPLNGILGYTQIFNRDNSLTVPQREGIMVIHKSGEYLLALINDILDLARMEAHQIVLEPIDFQFENFIHDLVNLFQMSAQQKGLEFHYECVTPLPPRVRADKKRLRQIFINLLSNAVKFTQVGGVTLKLNYQYPGLEVQIEDTGVGIPAAKLDGIFLPFHKVRVPNYHNNASSGVGLGLSITKTLIEQMGGKLQLQSTINQGTIFYFSLTLPDVSQGFRFATPATTVDSVESLCQDSARVNDNSELTVVDPSQRGLLLVGPQPEEARVLFELVMMGDVNGVIEYAEELKQRETRLVPFCNQVYQLARSFQERLLLEFIRQYLGGK